MKEYSVDRFEGEQAVLIDGNGEKKQVLRILLPPDTTEGDVLLFNGEQYYSDPVRTEQRRSEVRRLIDELFQ